MLTRPCPACVAPPALPFLPRLQVEDETKGGGELENLHIRFKREAQLAQQAKKAAGGVGGKERKDKEKKDKEAAAAKAGGGGGAGGDPQQQQQYQWGRN